MNGPLKGQQRCLGRVADQAGS